MEPTQHTLHLQNRHFVLQQSRALAGYCVRFDCLRSAAIPQVRKPSVHAGRQHHQHRSVYVRSKDTDTALLYIHPCMSTAGEGLAA